MRHARVVLVPLHQILFPVPVPAGMDWAVVGLWVLRFRKTNEPCDPPVEVERLGRGLYRLRDGRHRTVAAMVAGRREIEGVIT